MTFPQRSFEEVCENVAIIGTPEHCIERIT
jgi:hypothetical protein